MRFWVNLNGKVLGCFTPTELAKLEGFSSATLICPEEGEGLEKNWRRAAEFPDIIPALQELAARQKPAPPPETSAPTDVDKLLDSASSRLCSHVADLMKELDHAHEDKALILSLQRQVTDLNDQLQSERERFEKLEARMPRLDELEASQRKSADRIQSLESTVQERDRASADQRMRIEKTKNELENAKRSLRETTNDLSIRNRLVERLNHDLTEKEVSLAKALSLLKRLDEDLGTDHPDLLGEHRERIQALTGGKAGPSTALPSKDGPCAEAEAAAKDAVRPDCAARRAAPSGEEEPLPAPAINNASPDNAKGVSALAPTMNRASQRAVYTTDEPPQLPKIIVPQLPEQPAERNALVDFLKRFINKPQV